MPTSALAQRAEFAAAWFKKWGYLCGPMWASAPTIGAAINDNLYEKLGVRLNRYKKSNLLIHEVDTLTPHS